MENTEEKIKCYTVKHDSSTLYSEDTDYIFDKLRPMLEDQLKEDDEPMQFEFGVKFLTQSEIDALGEFDGF